MISRIARHKPYIVFLESNSISSVRASVVRPLLVAQSVPAVFSIEYLLKNYSFIGILFFSNILIRKGVKLFSLICSKYKYLSGGRLNFFLRSHYYHEKSKREV